MVVCAAFGLTVLVAKTEIMCQRAKGMPESTDTFSVEATGQVYDQMTEFDTSGETSTNADVSIEVDRRIRNAWCSFRPVRPIERSPRGHNPDAKSRGTRYNAVRLRHVKPVSVPLRHAAPSPP